MSEKLQAMFIVRGKQGSGGVEVEMRVEPKDPEMWEGSGASLMTDKIHNLIALETDRNKPEGDSEKKQQQDHTWKKLDELVTELGCEPLEIAMWLAKRSGKAMVAFPDIGGYVIADHEAITEGLDKIAFAGMSPQGKMC